MSCEYCMKIELLVILDRNHWAEEEGKNWEKVLSSRLGIFCWGLQNGKMLNFFVVNWRVVQNMYGVLHYTLSQYILKCIDIYENNIFIPSCILCYGIWVSDS